MADRILSIDLGQGMSGKTLEAQLVDTTGTSVGAAITSGFVDLGYGKYSLYLQGLSDSFIGSVIISDAGTSEYYGVASINQQDLVELPDLTAITDAISAMPEFRDILANARGKIVRSDTASARVLEFYDTDDTTIRFTVTVPDDKSGRTVV